MSYQRLACQPMLTHT